MQLKPDQFMNLVVIEFIQKIRIFDLHVKQVYFESLVHPQSIPTVDIKNWNEGMYFIQVEDEHGVIRNSKFELMR